MLYFGPKQTKDPHYTPAVMVKQKGFRTFQVRPVSQGGIWRRHIDQLQSWYPSTKDEKPGDDYSFADINNQNSNDDTQTTTDTVPTQAEAAETSAPSTSTERTSNSPAYGPGNPRRSKRTRKSTTLFVCYYWLLICVVLLLFCWGGVEYFSLTAPFNFNA